MLEQAHLGVVIALAQVVGLDQIAVLIDVDGGVGLAYLGIQVRAKIVQLLGGGSVNVVFADAALGAFVDDIGDLEVGDLLAVSRRRCRYPYSGVTLTALKPLL